MNNLQKIWSLGILITFLIGVFLAGSYYQKEFISVQDHNSGQSNRITTDVTEPSVGTTDDIIKSVPDDIPVSDPPTPPIIDSDVNDVVCTLDAKICPDGSAVGRVGPNCEFATCPKFKSKPSTKITTDIFCTDEQRQLEFCTEIYQPVCGYVAEDCLTEPCELLPVAFDNPCDACREKNVISYTAGSC